MDDDRAIGDGIENASFRTNGANGRCTNTRPGHPGGGGDWIGNGLDDVNLSGIDVGYGLSTPQGMAENGDLLAFEDMRGTAEYLVECALQPGQSVSKVVDGQTLVFEGALGLAPEWKDGSCDLDCQEWVSACLLARTNTASQSVDIWLSADHPSIGMGVIPDFPHHEATFYGNLFENHESQYLCLGSELGVLASFLAGRACAGQDPEACGFTTFTSCDTDSRCHDTSLLGWLFDTQCSDGGDPGVGHRYHSISVYVSDPEASLIGDGGSDGSGDASGGGGDSGGSDGNNDDDDDDDEDDDDEDDDDDDEDDDDDDEDEDDDDDDEDDDDDDDDDDEDDDDDDGDDDE